MKRLLLLLLPLALAPAWAGGFFDDFDGEDLGTHWSIGNPKGGWVYSVHDSLLEVHALTGFSPRQWINARIDELADFDMRARVGWTDTPQRQDLMVMLGNDPFLRGPFVAYMLYRRGSAGGGDSLLQAEFSGGPLRQAAAPHDGFHEFRITRNGSAFTAYLDDEIFLTGGGTTAPPTYVTLFFGGARDANVDLFVDSVSVVPEPLSALALIAMLGGIVPRCVRRAR